LVAVVGDMVLMPVFEAATWKLKKWVCGLFPSPTPSSVSSQRCSWDIVLNPMAVFDDAGFEALFGVMP